MSKKEQFFKIKQNKKKQNNKIEQYQKTDILYMK